MPAEDENRRTTVSQTIEKYRFGLLVAVSILIGILLLVVGYFTDPSHSSNPHPFLSFLTLQIGALLIFGAGYSFISDYFQRKNFVQLVWEVVNLDETIHESGLAQVQRKFSSEALYAFTEQCSSITMIVLRSNTFFAARYSQLRSRLDSPKGDFALQIVLPNPGNLELMTLMSAKFTDFNTPQKLAASIADVVNLWLKGSIYDKLKVERRSRLKVLFIDKYPLYSAYLFDGKEFWYIPYHFRNDHRDIPTFVFRDDFQSTEIYQDFRSIAV